MTERELLVVLGFVRVGDSILLGIVLSLGWRMLYPALKPAAERLLILFAMAFIVSGVLALVNVLATDNFTSHHATHVLLCTHTLTTVLWTITAFHSARTCWKVWRGPGGK